MRVEIFNNYEEISQYAASEFLNQIKKKPTSVLGFATGSSPIGVYKELIKDHLENKTSYKGVKTFNLDEYHGISPLHEQSYYHFMNNYLFKHLDLELNNIHIPNGLSQDVDFECKTYNDKLAKNVIDIQLLGIGRNGHIGFNEPGTTFESRTHYIALAEKTRLDNARFFHSLDSVPTHALTMGIQNILDAKKIILIATGSAKADAIASMIKKPITESCPASSLQLHKDVLVLLDQEASSKL